MAAIRPTAPARRKGRGREEWLSIMTSEHSKTPTSIATQFSPLSLQPMNRRQKHPLSTETLQWTILTEIGHGGSPGRKRGWVVHWPFQRVMRSKAKLSFSQSTPFPNLHCAPSQSLQILIITTPPSFRSAKAIGERAYCSSPSYATRLEFDKRSGIQQYWCAYNLGVFIGIRDSSAILSTAL